MSPDKSWATIGVRPETKAMLDRQRSRGCGARETWDHLLRRLAESPPPPPQQHAEGRSGRKISRIPGVRALTQAFGGRDGEGRNADAASVATLPPAEVAA